MIFKKTRYLLHFLALIILASCSTTSKNLIPNSNEILKGNSLKNFEDIYDYQSYFESDLEKIQKAIDNQQLNQEELKNAKILKRILPILGLPKKINTRPDIIITQKDKLNLASY